MQTFLAEKEDTDQARDDIGRPATGQELVQARQPSQWTPANRPRFGLFGF